MVTQYLTDYDLDIKNVNTDSTIVPKFFDFLTEYMAGNQFEFSQKYTLIEVSAGKIMKSEKAKMKKCKEWIKNSIIEHDAFGSLYLSNTSHLNGLFVVAKSDLAKIEKLLDNEDLKNVITIETPKANKTQEDLRAMLENRWVTYMGQLPKDKYEFIID